MSPIAVLAAVFVCSVLLLGVLMFFSKRTGRLDQRYFNQQWEEIASMYQRSEELWPQAIIKADVLLDEALKQQKYQGKTMGERLVSANRLFRDPDAVWRAHKTRNRLVHEPNAKVNRNNASAAMRGFRKALKDLGALQ